MSPILLPASWQQYQQVAAAVFERLGCSVAVDASIAGARSSHRVDVLVRFSRWGLQQTWIVECKYLKRRVSKSTVETFKSIMLDIGADKGFLLSEVGFQPAALSATRFTNVSLLSLQSLNEAVVPDIEQLLLGQLEVQVLKLTQVLKSLRMSVPDKKWGTVIRAKPGVNLHHVMSGIGTLMFLQDAMQGAKLGEYCNVIPRSFLVEEGSYIRLSTISVLLSEGFRLVSEIDCWAKKQSVRIQRAERLLAARCLGRRASLRNK